MNLRHCALRTGEFVERREAGARLGALLIHSPEGDSSSEMISITLPVLMAVSWMSVATDARQATVVASVAQPADVAAPASDMIKCPITGNQVPSCCCPVN